MGLVVLLACVGRVHLSKLFVLRIMPPSCKAGRRRAAAAAGGFWSGASSALPAAQRYRVHGAITGAVVNQRQCRVLSPMAGLQRGALGWGDSSRRAMRQARAPAAKRRITEVQGGLMDPGHALAAGPDSLSRGPAEAHGTAQVFILGRGLDHTEAATLAVAAAGTAAKAWGLQRSRIGGRGASTAAVLGGRRSSSSGTSRLCARGSHTATALASGM
mgnify:CR=1 FL=1